MEKIVDITGNLVAVVGVLICLAAGLARVIGNYYIFGYESEAFFIGGIALMVMGCLAKLHKLTR